ncbi:ABC-three component system protein [Sulfurovum sp.]|uniref:ABC-three component system protein n=1 Tax=Sulfurovum sp. TaxID=1969726 RepID=UPI00356173BF
MSLLGKYKEFSVIVDNGSGVLFQPMTDDYTYVLTAKHNIEAKSTDEIVIKNCEGENLTILEKYEHHDIDIAIVKIERIIGFVGPMKQIEVPKRNEKYILYGYPETRREEENKLNYFNLVFGHQDQNDCILSNSDFSEQSEMTGCSGGGVFKEENESTYIAGIEYRMDSSASSGESHNRIRMILIDKFDDIINANNEKLAPLVPPYFDNFSGLLEEIFLLRGMSDHNKIVVRNELQSIAKTHFFDKIKPIEIADKYGKNLLIDKQNESELYNHALWAMYLEFLVLCPLIDTSSPLNVTDLNDIYKKRKFLFAKTEDWTGLAEQILLSDLSGLEKNGIVIIGCDGDREPTRCKLSKTVLENIDRVLPGERRIDSGISKPYEDLTFKHIHAIQKQMIDDDEYFDDADRNNVEEKIKDELSKVFS